MVTESLDNRTKLVKNELQRVNNYLKIKDMFEDKYQTLTYRLFHSEEFKTREKEERIVSSFLKDYMVLLEAYFLNSPYSLHEESTKQRLRSVIYTLNRCYDSELTKNIPESISYIIDHNYSILEVRLIKEGLKEEVILDNFKDFAIETLQDKYKKVTYLGNI